MLFASRRTPFKAWRLPQPCGAAHLSPRTLHIDRLLPRRLRLVPHHPWSTPSCSWSPRVAVAGVQSEPEPAEARRSLAHALSFRLRGAFPFWHVNYCLAPTYTQHWCARTKNTTWVSTPDACVAWPDTMGVRDTRAAMSRYTGAASLVRAMSR